MRLSIDGIALFFRENWQFLLSMMPVAVVLFLLFRKLFQLAKADLKGVIGAFLTVFGVLAAIIVPGLIIDPDLWGKIMYLIILGAFFVFFLINDPKGVLKTVLITLAACAFVIAVGLIFGFGAAAAVAANGFFCIFPAAGLLLELPCFRSLKRDESLPLAKREVKGVIGWILYLCWDV